MIDGHKTVATILKPQSIESANQRFSVLVGLGNHLWHFKNVVRSRPCFPVIVIELSSDRTQVLVVQ